MREHRFARDSELMRRRSTVARLFRTLRWHRHEYRDRDGDAYGRGSSAGMRSGVKLCAEALDVLDYRKSRRVEHLVHDLHDYLAAKAAAHDLDIREADSEFLALTRARGDE